MIVPGVHIPPASEEAPAASLVVEVERDVFMGLLKQPQKPLVLVHVAGFPKTTRYYLRYGGDFFLYRTREPEDFSGVAATLPVKAFHASPAAAI